MRLAILGGGGFRTPLVWQALRGDTAEPRIDEVVLIDSCPDRLRAIELVVGQLGDGPRAPSVSATTSLREGLAGSDFVFAAIRVGGVAGRVGDERVALDLGLLGQETTGPGGIAYALRTVPVMLDVARAVAEVAPTAYVVNFTNPAGIVTEAMRTVLGDRVVGICDTPSGLGRRVAAALGIDAGEVALDYVGLNHLGWLRRVLHRGRDVLPELLADDSRLGLLEETRIFGADWLRRLGCIPNEYLYYYYRNREAVAALRAAGQTRGEFLAAMQPAFFADVLAAPGRAAEVWQLAVDAREASYMAEATGGEQGNPAYDRHAGVVDPAQLGYAGVALAVMSAIARNAPASAILNVANGETVAALPADAVVEVPCLVDGNGVHPLSVPAPDAHQVGLMAAVKAVERHAISAAVTGSRDEALLAMAMHPLVGSLDLAEQLLSGYEAADPGLSGLFGARG